MAETCDGRRRNLVIATASMGDYGYTSAAYGILLILLEERLGR